AGAALVHEYEVAVLADLRKRLRDAGGVFSGGGTWATGEVEERIRFALCARGGQDDDLEIDLATFARGAIFVNFERAASRLALHALKLAVFQDARAWSMLSQIA